jgi:hypothetical protein
MTAEHPQKTVKTLWLLICVLSYGNELYPFYAVSEEEAEQKAQAWINQQGPRIRGRISLNPSPNGFTIHYRELPGRIFEEHGEKLP